MHPASAWRRLGRLGIRSKLLLLFVLPLLCFGAVAGQVALEHRRTAAETRALKTLIDLGVTTGRLLHETQRERGMTAVFVASGGDSFKAELVAQRADTDLRVEELRAAVAHERSTLDASTIEDLERVEAALAKLPGIRASASNLSGDAASFIAYYTALNAGLLTAVADVGQRSGDGDLARLSSAYLLALEAKEKAGIERAEVSSVLARRAFLPGQAATIASLIGAQQTLIEHAVDLAPGELAQALRAETSGAAFQRVAELERGVLEARTAADFPVEAKVWFEAATARIAALKGVEDALSGQLHATADAHLAAAERAVSTTLGLALLFLVVLAISIVVLSRTIAGPLVRMAQAAAELALGDLEQAIDHEGTDELGQLADSLRSMVTYLRSVAAATASVSRGDLAFELTERSAKDELTTNIQRMGEAVRALVEQVGGLAIFATYGSVDIRLAPSEFEGAFRDVAEGANQMVDALIAPIEEATEVFERVAARDLTAAMVRDYRGDHVRLKDAANLAIDHVRAGMTQVARGAEQVKAASAQIASGSQSLASGASEQAAALTETRSTLEEVASMTERNARSAETAHELATSASGLSTQGARSMEQLRAAVGSVKDAVANTAEIIRDINQIAFQTNLLALNAAVEAARAGDAGSGFAVVADEVRSLAQQAKSAAHKTEGILGEAMRQATEGERVSKDVRSGLAAIVEVVSRVSEVVGTISEASAGQASGMRQVSTATCEMDAVTQQNAAASEELSSTAEQLAAQAQDLTAMVSSFELGEDANVQRRRGPRPAAPSPMLPPRPRPRGVDLRA
jgi:methyl-accepting chemotaxis protein